MTTPLGDSRLKIDRAKQHITEFDSRITQFLSRKPYSLVSEPHTDPGYERLVWKLHEPIPADLPCILGDAIHNLRSALDIAAVELVARNDPTVDLDEVHFPFTKAPKEFE